MRNNLTVCNGPQQANAATIGRGHSRRRRTMRGLLALPLALALIAPGTTALAASTTTGYSQVTPPPKTTPATTPTPTPKGEAAPTQTSSTPTETGSSNAPTSSSEPTATTATKAAAKTLPFTGLDLRWVILGGVLLVGMGMSIMVAQRSRSTNR